MSECDGLEDFPATQTIVRLRAQLDEAECKLLWAVGRGVAIIKSSDKFGTYWISGVDDTFTNYQTREEAMAALNDMAAAALAAAPPKENT